jgi:hypothetical protein
MEKTPDVIRPPLIHRQSRHRPHRANRDRQQKGNGNEMKTMSKLLRLGLVAWTSLAIAVLNAGAVSAGSRIPY